MDLKKNKFLIIVFVILMVISVILLYLNNNDNTNYEEQTIDIDIIDKYKENQYIPVNITYDQMAKIYLQDYVNKLMYDREDAYNTVDKKYRETKFTSFEDFNKYVDDILMSSKLHETIVTKYAVTDEANYRYYDIYDSANNLFIFKENGVMQYTVFFDRYTTNMK